VSIKTDFFVAECPECNLIMSYLEFNTIKFKWCPECNTRFKLFKIKRFSKLKGGRE